MGTDIVYAWEGEVSRDGVAATVQVAQARHALGLSRQAVSSVDQRHLRDGLALGWRGTPRTISGCGQGVSNVLLRRTWLGLLGLL
jgi:hypothetical protein